MSEATFEIREDFLNPAASKHYEGAFTQGSAYLQIRGSFEEGLACAPQGEKYWRLPANVTLEKQRSPRSKCGTYVPGVMGNHPLLNEEIINLPNPLVFKTTCNGEALDMDLCQIKNYSRVLNMKNAVLTRHFVWETKSGAKIDCLFERFVSRVRHNLIIQKITFKTLEGNAALRFESDIDADVTTNGYSHFSSCDKTLFEDGLRVKVVTDKGEKVWLETRTFGDNLRFKEAGSKMSAEISLPKGKEIVIHKISGICSSRDTLWPVGPEWLSSDVASAVKDLNKLFSENALVWEKLWKNSGVVIEGDETAQKAINFATYHLLRSICQNDDRVAICAKGFAGEAYFGHFFWDTEIYLLPFFLYTNPEYAKNLVSFRVKTLEGARKNARRYGLRGARYPWESSVSGTEQCPNWQYADHELHVTADVIYGIWHYYKATGDQDFLWEAAPVFYETTRYWVDRVEMRADNSVHLNGVMGPDEYTCLSSDNAYTNAMVRFALEKTLQLQEEAPGIDDDLQKEAKKIIKKLPVKTLENGVIIQCREFERMEEPDFENTWTDRSQCYGSVVPQEKLYRTKALKQADALMLPFLFPEKYTAEAIKNNLDYYLKYTTHDSSLSYIVHAILMARVGLVDEAYELMQKALQIDLSDYHGGAAEGIHIANCGGIWQAVVLGFAGLIPAVEEVGEEPIFHPHLPKAWRSLSFPLTYRGKKYQVEIKDNKVKTTLCEN